MHLNAISLGVEGILGNQTSKGEIIEKYEVMEQIAMFKIGQLFKHREGIDWGIILDIDYDEQMIYYRYLTYEEDVAIVQDDITRFVRYYGLWKHCKS